MLLVTTPRTEAAAVPAGRTVSLKTTVSLRSSVDGCVALTSVDARRPLSESRRLVLLYQTEEANSGMRLGADRETLHFLGHNPSLCRTGKLELSLKLLPADWKLYALGLDGSRREEIPLSSRDGRILVRFHTGKLKSGPTTFFRAGRREPEERSCSMKKPNRMFTLIELLITVAVIAVLAGLLLPALNSARRKALAIQCVSNMKQVGLQIVLYADANSGFWPISKASVIQERKLEQGGVAAAAAVRSASEVFFLSVRSVYPDCDGNPDRFFRHLHLRHPRISLGHGSGIEADLPLSTRPGMVVNGTSGVVAFNPAKVKRPSAYQMIADSVNYSPSSDYYGMPYYFLKDSNSGGYHLIHQDEGDRSAG